MSYELSIQQAAKMLQTLNTYMEKAQQHADAKKFDIDVLLNSRLAPDQFNFIRQVQIACDTAKFGAARLSGKEAPSHPDTEKTVAELQARIKSVTAYLADFTAKDFADAPKRVLSHKFWEGKTMLGESYLHQYFLPNLYFHVVTAYSILRHNGVDIGKKDYLSPYPFMA